MIRLNSNLKKKFVMSYFTKFPFLTNQTKILLSYSNLIFLLQDSYSLNYSHVRTYTPDLNTLFQSNPLLNIHTSLQSSYLYGPHSI